MVKMRKEFGSSFDDRRGGSGGQTAATAVITASIYFHFTAQSALSMLGLSVWLNMIPR